MQPLTRSFFARPTLDVAKDLIGKTLVFLNTRAVILETEAYFGDDPASHGSRGKTDRNFPMFGPAGFTYVYLIYGMYHCLNFSTEKEYFPAAVLIRSIRNTESEELFDGPGKLCNHLGVTREHNNIDTCSSDEIYLIDEGMNFKTQATPRIGIKQNVEKKWRFVASEE